MDPRDESPSSDPARHGDPGSVVVEQGYVLLDGPDGIAVTMSPEAAEETGRRLIDAARRARDEHASITRGGA
jgi:hypothetical protein